MKSQIIYVGNCSNKGLYKYKFINGKLFFCTSTDDFARCTYLSKYNNNIYGVIEICDEKNEGNGYVVSYIEKEEKIVNTGIKSSYGQGPCHISINSNKSLIFVSNYKDGHFVIYKIDQNNAIGEKIFNEVIDEKKSRVHYSQMIDDKFLCVVDLGINTIIVYDLENNMKETSRVVLGKDVEPRHLVVNKDLIYVVTEVTCELYVLKFQNKELKIMSKQSILPQNEEIKNNYTGCAIKISNNKKYIYISIRGHNSISVFKCCDNAIRLIQNIKSNGDIPRDIELDKHEKYLFSANEDSNNISIFKRNKFTGKLKLLNKIEVESPTCIIAK